MATSALGCSHDWDAYDPRLQSGGSGGTGGTITTGSGGTGAGTTLTGGGGSGGATSSSTGATGGMGGAGGMGGSGGNTGGMGGSGGAVTTGGMGGVGGTGGMGGAGGMGGTSPCGGTSVLADDFDTADAGEVWDSYVSGGAMVTESGGDLVMTLPVNGADGSYAEITTYRYYDFRNDTLATELKSAGTGQTAYAFFSLGIDGSDYLAMVVQNGFLSIERTVNDQYSKLKTTPYNPVTHRYLRYRSDGTTVFWETSSDGTTWMTQSQVAMSTLFPLDLVRINLGSGIDPPDTTSEVRFGSVNFGVATQKWCPTSTIKDDFNDGVEGPMWSRSWQDIPGMLTETGGELVLTYTPNDTTYASRRSATSFDLTESSILIEIPVAPDLALEGSMHFDLLAPNNSDIQMAAEGDQLAFDITVNGMEMSLGSVLFVPDEHRWWRIRESGGTLYWETSPNGTMWTVQSQLAPIPIPIDVLDVALRGGTWTPQPTPGSAHYDNLNLPPP